MRPATLLVVLALVIACQQPEPPPSPKPVPVAPKPPPPASKPASKPAPPPLPVVEPDPPGTIYNWEDSAGQIHVTQTPPPVGARLISKELPRVVDTDPEPDAPVAPADAANDALATALIAEINRIRADPFGHAASLSKDPAAGEAVKMLRAGRRAFATLSRSDALDEAARTGERPGASKGLHRLSRDSTDAATTVYQWLTEATAVRKKAILDPAARVIGAACGDTCRVYIATSASR